MGCISVSAALTAGAVGLFGTGSQGAGRPTLFVASYFLFELAVLFFVVFWSWRRDVTLSPT